MKCLIVADELIRLFKANELISISDIPVCLLRGSF